MIVCLGDYDMENDNDGGVILPVVQAQLSAVVAGQEVSTVVSTSELAITTGLVGGCVCVYVCVCVCVCV